MNDIEELVKEIAEARSPRKGLNPEVVIERAMLHINQGRVSSAPKAVEWAFHDLWDSERERPINGAEA